MNVAIAPLVTRKFQVIGRLVIMDDITERVELEGQLSQADKLSSIGLLAAGVAHEVNTPLAVISSYTQMLAKQLQGDPQKSGLLEKITRQTFRASEIVNNLLNFSRTSGTEFADVDVNKVITDTLALLEHQFKIAKIQVQSELTPRHLADSRESRKAAAGVLESLLERERCDAGRREVCSVATSNGDLVSVRVSRHRFRHCAGAHSAHLRSVLHHEDGAQRRPEPGHGTWPFCHLRHHSGACREDSRGKRSGSRDDVRARFPAEQEGRPCLKQQSFRAAHCTAITSPAGSVLIIDDEAEIRESLQTLLEMEGFEVETAVSGEDGLGQMAERPFDLVLLDLTLPGRNGMEILAEIRSHDSRLPVIMITAYGTVENAVRAMQSGAANFVQKPWDNEKLLADVRAAVGWRRAEEENVQLKRALKQRYNFENIVGKSEPMLKIFDLVAQVANSRSTVLLQGESGTGKEVIAKAVHLNSPRRDKPFVPVNTGFDADRSARVHSVWPRQRRVHQRDRVEEGAVRSRGQGHALPRRNRNHGSGDAGQDSARACRTAGSCIWAEFRKSRLMCGSSPRRTSICGRWCAKDGSAKICFYRLNVITVELPPLRQRKEDIPLLVEFFLKSMQRRMGVLRRRVTPEALRPLMAYSWPGNVRELENVIERAVVLSSGPEISMDLLPESIDGHEVLRSRCTILRRMRRCSRSWKMWNAA